MFTLIWLEKSTNFQKGKRRRPFGEAELPFRQNVSAWMRRQNLKNNDSSRGGQANDSSSSNCRYDTFEETYLESKYQTPLK